MATMETPHYWSYRNPGRFYAEFENDSKPGNEVWYFDLAEGRLVGFDKSYHQLVGRFGPDGFTPAGVRPGERFHGELRYRIRWYFRSDTAAWSARTACTRSILPGARSERSLLPLPERP